MEPIAELCDYLLLGSPGRSSTARTYEVRVIVRNQDGCYGVVYDYEKWLFHFPGFMTEKGSADEASVRQYMPILTGCTAKSVVPLCSVFEDSKILGRRRLTQYFLAETACEQDPMWRCGCIDTEVFQWLDLYDLKSRIKSPLHSSAVELYSQFKDGIACAFYSQICPEERVFQGKMIAPGLVSAPMEDELEAVGFPMPENTLPVKNFVYDTFYGGVMEIIGPSRDEDAIG